MNAYRSYGSIFQFYNGLLLVPVYLWLWKGRAAILNGPLYMRLLFQIPTVILAAGYLCLVLSCLFPGNLFVIVTPILFFSLAAHVLAIETPIIAFKIVRSTQKGGLLLEESLELDGYHRQVSK